MSAVIGRCMPDAGFIASIIGELKGIEGYAAGKGFAVAVFSSKFEGGKVQVQKNMHRAFKNGEAVYVIVMTQRKPPVEQKPAQKG